LFVVAVSAVCGFGLYYYATKTQSDFVPQTDMGDLSVRLEYAADSNLAHTAERARALAARLAKDPAVRHVLVTNGKVQGMIGQVSEGSYMAEVQLRLSPKVERPDDRIADVLQRIRRLAGEEPDCLWSVMAPSIVGGSEADTIIMVSGADLDELNRIGTEAQARFREDPTTSDVSNSVRPGRPEINLRPNRAVLHDMGVATSDLGMVLRANVAGLKTTTYKQGDRSYDIRVRYVQRQGREQIPAMNLPGPDGRPMQLSAVTEQSDRIQPTQIVRYDKVRSVTLYANVAKDCGMGTTVAHETSILAKLLPAGYAMSFSGMAEKMAEAMQEFGLVIGVAVLLTYLLLAAMLESWTQPFIILLTVPFSYLGLYMAVYHTGTSVSIFGQLAGVMLVGVVVNAAILLIDEVNTLRRERGLHKREALIAAAESKFRPILMSCVAALFGMLPMATGTGLGSEMRASIGIGSVGGIIVSSVLSLYFIPAFYVVVGKSDKRSERNK
jgi:HAE1 family hydrophobic/amphiphilic exporter-1